MQIKSACYEDLPEILELQYLAYQSEARLCGNPKIPPLTQALCDLQAEFEKGIFLKAVDETGIIIGSVRGYCENGTLFIGKLIVRPDVQGQGIGTKLLQEIETMCPQARYELFTSTKSVRNIKLYERLGYVRFKDQDMGNGLRFIYLNKTK